MPNSLKPHGLQPASILCPWDSLSKDTGVGCQCPPPKDLPNPGIEPVSPACPELQMANYYSQWDTNNDGGLSG